MRSFHPEIEGLGFIQYGRNAEGWPRTHLPVAKAGCIGPLCTAKWDEWFGPSFCGRSAGSPTGRKVFHSFRHTFKHFAGHVGMLEGVQRDIMGHSSGDAADDYRGGYSQHQLVEGMAIPGGEANTAHAR